MTRAREVARVAVGSAVVVLAMAVWVARGARVGTARISSTVSACGCRPIAYARRPQTIGRSAGRDVRVNGVAHG